MSSPRKKRCNTVKAASVNALKALFWGMAYDLKVTHVPDVVDAYADLSAGRYVSFLGKLDAMTSQMYTSTEDEVFRLHQLASLLSKYPFEDPSIDRKAAAMRKFYKAEHKCRRMNQKFRARRDRWEPAHMQFMRDYILSVIGATPNYERIYSMCDFGPGSSVGVHGCDTTFVRKLRHLSCTPAAVPVALAALARNRHYLDILGDGRFVCLDPDLTLGPDAGAGASNEAQSVSPRTSVAETVKLVQYNKITCVPKNAKTDRTIAIEPTLNGFIQKGIDLYLRSKLLRVGCNLSSQSLNSSLACLGSRDGTYSTIDLSAASDSMSIQLVKELLPPDWFALLDTARSPAYKLDSNDSSLQEVRRYEKFCSMGNGFCFPLETLIFRAAVEYAMSVTHFDRNRTCAVYGDDIVVPYECALLLIEVLRDLGFSTNVDKTFVVGGFKESCGADYFFGENVRPIFVKKPLQLKHDTYPLLNELSRRKLGSAWKNVYDMIPSRWRYIRPYRREDDTAIEVPMDVFMSSRHAKWDRSTYSWVWKKVVPTASAGRHPTSERELLAGKLRGDLKTNEQFSFRFSETTRVQVGT